MSTASTKRLVVIGGAAAAMFLAASALVTAVVFPPLRAVDEGAHIAHGYAISEGRLPSVLDPQSGGPYTYRTDRTLYTAHHPPLFPAVVGPVIRAGNLFGDKVLAVRAAAAVSAFFGAMAILATAALLREVVPDNPPVWIAGAAFVAATPAFAHISGVVYNDALAVAVTTAVGWIGLRILRLGPTPRRVAALSVLATLASLTRISAIPIALVAVAVAALGAHRAGSTARGLLRVVAWPLAAMAIGAGWFYVRNLHLYDDLSGGDELYDLLDRRPREIGTLLRRPFIEARIDGFWTGRDFGNGKFNVGPTDTLVEIGVVILVIAGIGILAAAIARRRRRVDPALVAFGLVSTAVALGGFVVHVTSGGTPHSRYLFGLLWLGGLAFGVCLSKLPRGVATGLLAVLLAGSALSNLLTTDQVLRSRIGPWNDLADFWADSSLVVEIVLVLIAVAIIAAGAITVRSYDRLRARERSSPPTDLPMKAATL